MAGGPRPLAVLLKALILFLVLESAIMRVAPTLEGASVYAAAHLDRPRFPVSTLSPVDDALDVGNLRAMFAAHVISQPKAADEFRVLVLGDSATWGTQMDAGETLPAQLDSLGLKCGNRNVHVYNLSFPRSSATKDLMILDEAMSSRPDLVIWMLTWYTLMPKTRTDHFLITQNQDEYYKLARRFDFLPKDYALPSAVDEITGRVSALYRIARFQVYALIQRATGMDQLPGPPIGVPLELSADATFEGMRPPTLRLGQVSLDQVKDAYTVAGSTPLVVVNEPMLILEGVPNSGIRYNGYYPRWVYDQYRRYLGDEAVKDGWDYLDLWDAFPPWFFGDTPLHLIPEGQRSLALRLVPEIYRHCP
jgi:hypothetical protein